MVGSVVSNSLGTSHPHAYSNRLMINGSSGNELFEYKEMEGKVKDLHGG